MQELQDAITPVGKTDASFIGLNAYAEEDRYKFFGRDTEAANLYRLIKSNTLTCVFGKSGTGKTSLLNAGVFPKLREDNGLPFRIRLSFDQDSPSLKQQLWQVLHEQITRYGFIVRKASEHETLWEFFHREDLWKIVTPILVFDQFEEIFTLAGKHASRKKEVQHLLTELADLIENTIPEDLRKVYLEKNQQINFNYKSQRAKIIFAFREDFLPEMESITANIPSVKNSRFRLTAMGGHQAFEVITKTWKDEIKPAEATRIVYYLTTATDGLDFENKDSDFDLVQIEPSLLSQVCTYLDKERLQTGQNAISAGFLSNYPKDNILSAIYHQALAEAIHDLDTGEAAAHSRNPLREFIEDKLITDEGYRTKYTSTEIPGFLQPGIGSLQRKYFIREEGPAVELTHDVMAGIVREDRDNRRKKDAKKLADARAKKKAFRFIAIAAVLALLAWVSSGMYSYLNVQKAQQAIEKFDSVEQKIRIEEKRLADLKANKGNPDLPPVIVPATDSTIESLQDSLDDVHAELSNARELIKMHQQNEAEVRHHETIIADQNRLIAYYQKHLEDLPLLRWRDSTRRAYVSMYQSHIDRIIQHRMNADSLQNYINLISQHREGFQRVLKY